jgi:Glycosyltransferase family 87
MGVEAPATSDGGAAASGRSLTHTIIGWAIALVLWVMVLASIAAFATMLKKFDRATREDFAVYYLEGQELRHAVDPYTTNFMSAARAQGLTTHDIGHGSDPPTFVAFLIEPLTLLPIRTAYWIWQAANLLCLAAALPLLLGPQVGFSSPFAAAFALLTIFYPAVPAHFLFGQSKLPVLLLLVITMRLLERKRDRLAGLALAMAVLLRFFPLVMAGYLILQRRWRALACAILAIVVGAVLTIAVSGLSNCASFFVSASGLVNDSVAGINRDISLYFFVSRNLAALSQRVGLHLESVRLAIVYTIDLAVMAATTRATLAFPPNGDRGSRLFSLWVATSIFLLPVAWDYDLTLMLIPFALIALAAARGKASRRTIATAIISYAVLVWWEFVAQSANEGGFYSMLAAYLAAYWFATDQPGRNAGPIWSLPVQLWRRITLPAQASAT